MSRKVGWALLAAIAGAWTIAVCAATATFVMTHRSFDYSIERTIALPGHRLRLSLDLAPKHAPTVVRTDISYAAPVPLEVHVPFEARVPFQALVLLPLGNAVSCEVK